MTNKISKWYTNLNKWKKEVLHKVGTKNSNKRRFYCVKITINENYLNGQKVAFTMYYWDQTETGLGVEKSIFGPINHEQSNMKVK